MNLVNSLYETRALAQIFFDELIKIPEDIRPDVKQRTGIAVLLRELGNPNNLIFFEVGKPSDRAKFFVSEKSIRAEENRNLSSGATANPDLYKFAGCVGVNIHGIIFHASVSGLKAEEDEFLAIHLLARLLKTEEDILLLHLSRESIISDFSAKELAYLKKIID